MLENAGYDQNEDEYTEKNASFVLGVPSTYQMTSPQQEPEHLTCKPVTELTNTEVVMRQPQPGPVMNIIQKPLPNHIVPALFVCCMFWPTGLVAVYFAFKTRNLKLSGDYGNAKKMSDCARKWIIATICIGLILGFFSVIVYYAGMMILYSKNK
ncbi:proline-rich transmembrane protein 1-like [Ruditapes philippinarum]|uniref:proline-rich transmembrane protein 1-like n=1 Tax=Ruditapes philippinarum TaxID=129788 RepID=UPI00295A790C|nr:proline-rich transmembrane protein 1-like [Ruditapes philippinarum]